MDNTTIQNLLSINLFEELGIEYLTPEEQMVFIEKMGEAIQGRIILRVLKELPEEKKEKIDEALSSESGNFDSILQVISELLPNYEQVINEEVANYKKEIIERYNQK